MSRNPIRATWPWPKGHTITTFLLVTAFGLVGSPLRAQSRDASKDDGATRLREMQRLVQAIQFFEGKGETREAVEPLPEPLFRWDDPSRNFRDGALWSLGRTGRPIAILSTGLNPHPVYDAVWSLELISLSASPVVAEGAGGYIPLAAGPVAPEKGGPLRWTPRGPGLEPRPFPDAPAPADTEVGRLRQMRELAGRFAASEFNQPNRQRFELRLLPRPIHRYADMASGLIDGTIFLFAYGTDPEVLVLIEARRLGSSAPAWQYGLARLSRAEVSVSLDRGEVWRQPYALRPSPEDPYYIVRSIRIEGE
jgi:hypothetical protein